MLGGALRRESSWTQRLLSVLGGWNPLGVYVVGRAGMGLQGSGCHRVLCEGRIHGISEDGLFWWSTWDPLLLRDETFLELGNLLLPGDFLALYFGDYGVRAKLLGNVLCAC